MRRGILVLLVFLFPNFVQAQCLDKGYTVIFVNGIFNTEKEAEVSTQELWEKLGTKFNGEPLSVKLGYNQTHVEGLGDLAQVAAQGFGGTISTYDRDTILMQIAPELSTRKVLLVGHSQGTFYTNDIYSYFLSHGEPKESVGVYNVATPASFVAGGGNYMTSQADTIIALFADYAKRTGAQAPLSPNADLGLGGALGNGHNFVNNYLAYGGEKIAAEIKGELASLKATWAEETAGCFSPPENTLSYKASQTFFAVIDPVATGVKVATVTTVNGATLAFNSIKTGLAAVGSFFATAPTATTEQTAAENLPGSHDVVRALYGSSITEKDLQDLAQSQGGAVALAFGVSSPDVVIPGEVKGAATENFEPLIPPTRLIVGGTPGFGGGGGNAPAPAVVVNTESPAAPTEEITVPPEPEEETPTPPVDETPVEEVTPPEEATSTPPAPPEPEYTVLYEQMDASVLGETVDPYFARYPGEKLGNGLSGTLGSVAYKVHGTNLQPLIDEGAVSVQIRDCMIDNGSYAPIGHCQYAVSNFPNFYVQILAQDGDDSTLLAVMDHPYTFDPTHYYWIRFSMSGDMAMYGSSSENSFGGDGLLGAWISGVDFVGYEMDTNGVKDWAFRMCSTDTCAF